MVTQSRLHQNTFLLPLNGYSKAINDLQDLDPDERNYIVAMYIESFRPRRGSLLVTVSDVIDVVAEVTQIPRADMLKRCRSRELTYPRQLAMYFATQVCERTYPGIALAEAHQEAIGAVFGLERTTVIHGRKTIKDLISVDQDAKALVQTIDSKLQELFKSRLADNA